MIGFSKKYTCQKCTVTFRCDRIPKFCVVCGSLIVDQNSSDHYSQHLKEDQKTRSINDQDRNDHYLTRMQKHLREKGLIYDSDLEKRIQDRKNGRKFSTADHVAGLVYSQLSNQTKWIRIFPHLAEIDELFFQFDIDKILSSPYEYFVNGLFRIKCGNISTEAQMKALKQNILKMQNIERSYGSMDAFVVSAPAYKVVERISGANSPYKFMQIGPALAWEYLRNVGVDGAKPDTHTRRFLGADRMGNSTAPIASPKEVYEQVEVLAGNTNLSRVTIDNIIWSYCADGYGAICTATPKCNLCVVRDVCNYQP